MGAEPHRPEVERHARPAVDRCAHDDAFAELEQEAGAEGTPDELLSLLHTLKHALHLMREVIRDAIREVIRGVISVISEVIRDAIRTDTRPSEVIRGLSEAS